VVESKVLRSIREEVAGGWRKLHVELHEILLVIKLRKMRWSGHVVLMEDTRNAYKIVVGKPGRKRTHGRPVR
jgi:hypothetical protein